MNTNLLKETITAIIDSGHIPNDIIFIGSEKSGHECVLEQFEQIANFNYYSGCGGQEIAQDLTIVFSDGRKLWRGEYDGSEWWEYSTVFKKPAITLPLIHLMSPNGDSWCDLKEFNPIISNDITPITPLIQQGVKL